MRAISYATNNKHGFVNGEAAVNAVPWGGTLHIDGIWDCSRDGPIYSDKPLHIKGNGSCRINGEKYPGGFGASSLIENSHTGSQEAIILDLPDANETQGLTMSDFAIRHRSPDHFAITQKESVASVTERIFIDCAWGYGGIYYGEGCFFTKARDVIVRDFNGYGVKIEARGNDYAFYNCDVATKRRSHLPNKAIAALHCINSGLTVYQGTMDCQNNTYDGVGVSIYNDRVLRPRTVAMGAYLQGVYAENCDIPIQVDATDGHLADGVIIESPHWDTGSGKIKRGVNVIRGKNVVVNNPRCKFVVGSLEYIANFNGNPDCYAGHQAKDISQWVLQ